MMRFDDGATDRKAETDARCGRLSVAACEFLEDGFFASRW
jgi:hypothetical protein